MLESGRQKYYVSINLLRKNQKTCPYPSQHYENLFLNMLYSCYVRCSLFPPSSFHLFELAKVWRCYVKHIVVLLGWVSFPITHPNPLAFVHYTLECCSFLMWAITVGQPLFCTSLGLGRPQKKHPTRCEKGCYVSDIFFPDFLQDHLTRGASLRRHVPNTRYEN